MDLLLILIAGLNLFLALLILSRGYKNKANLYFALFIMGAAVWPFSIALFQMSNTLAEAYFWDVFIYLSGTLVPVSFLFFAWLFTHKKALPALATILCLGIPIALSISLILPGIFIQSVNITPDTKSVSLGPLYIVWVTYFCIFMALGSYWLWRSFLISRGREHQQLAYILLAILFPVIGSLPFNIFLPLFGNYRLIAIGPIFLTIMIAIVSYAIIKHSLMDIRFIAARTVAYSLLIILVSVFYALSAFILSSTLLGLTAGFNQLTIYTALTVFVALSFDRLRNFLEKFTDQIFFKGSYDSDRLLSVLGKIMGSYIELYSLADKLLQTLTTNMRISRGAFILLGESAVYDIISVGFQERLNLSFTQIKPMLTGSRDMVVYDELEEGEVRDIMRRWNLALLRFLKAGDKTVGILVLGEKASGDIYSQGDLNVLEILGPELAIAIQNSQSYDKIKKFNIILSEEVKKATANLEIANRRLKELDNLKDDFVSVASHELRTPMTSIRSYAWMALYKPDVVLSTKLKKYLERIFLSTEKLINLVNDLLNISRIESGSIEIKPEPIKLALFIREIVEEIRPRAQERNLEVFVMENQVPEVFADYEKLRQIMLNLIGNSLKFTPAGGKIIISFFADGNRVETSVKDTGIGIDKQDLSRLFAKFGRLDNSYTATVSSEGTGLGLFICKSLVELMQGRIWAVSEGEGKGATFTFSLPIATRQRVKDADKFHIRPTGEIKGLEPVAL